MLARSIRLATVLWATASLAVVAQATAESEFFGPPWEDRSLESLLRSSPIIHAENVTTPTMFVHGESHLRVPIEEAEQMYVALKKRGVPATFVRYPESYHGGSTPWRYGIGCTFSWTGGTNASAGAPPRRMECGSTRCRRQTMMSVPPRADGP